MEYTFGHAWDVAIRYNYLNQFTKLISSENIHDKFFIC